MEWISVNDRLPDFNGKDVLVCDGICMTVACFTNGEWKLFFDFWEVDEITHWMPLPEPPKEIENVQNKN